MFGILKLTNYGEVESETLRLTCTEVDAATVNTLIVSLDILQIRSMCVINTRKKLLRRNF